MKLSVTFDTGHPAKLQGLEGAVAVVFQNERPLRGVAAHADWRLNGFLSRHVAGDRFGGERGDWLLVHTQGRLPFTHLFLVGMGRRDGRDPAKARTALAGIAGKVALAGVHRFAIDLAEVAPPELPPEEAMVHFLEALSRAYPADDEADPPYAPALEARERNAERLAAFRRKRQDLAEAYDLWDAERRAYQSAVDQTLPEADEVERPIAGELPPEPPPEPPRPDSLAQPELEPEPERTVQVVLLGDPGTTGAMRTALRRLGDGGDGPLAVEWSR